MLWTNGLNDTLRTRLKVDTAWFHTGVVVDDSIRITRPVGMVGQIQIGLTWGKTKQETYSDFAFLQADQQSVALFNEDVISGRNQLLQVNMTRWYNILNQYFHATIVAQLDTLATDPVQRILYHEYNLNFGDDSP